MPAEQQQNRPISAPSPTSKTTSKYSNKDGSKFITVRKSSAEESPTLKDTPKMPSKPEQPAPKAALNKSTPMGVNGGAPPAINRKKQKRRQKQAARAAEQNPATEEAQTAVVSTNGHDYSHPPLQNGDYAHPDGQSLEYENQDFDDPDYYSEEDQYYDPHHPANGIVHPTAPATKKKSRKKKGRSDMMEQHSSQLSGVANSQLTRAPPHHHQVPQPPQPLSVPSSRISKDRIWNTSTQEERERIKEFWLGLGEEERRSLVKVEKEAVLRKMKEQQKHSCSCTVCGRKRTAIEEELEVLYDAYYDELESYANREQDPLPPLTQGPAKSFGHMARVPHHGQLPPLPNIQQATHGSIAELDDEDEVEEEDYSGTDGEGYSDEGEDEPPPGAASDFFSFGNSLTVQGGILTVADDLLKNDGKKFIEMMEQLAERRMQREEEAQNAAYSLGHPPLMSQHSHAGHNHPPLPEDEEYDEEEEDDYDSQEEEEYDDEEMDTMTDEQRMEEGRRMFQIFAARMFEQRVLTAYREKVAAERQEKLLEELAEEEKVGDMQKAKKAKEAQKRKEKKRLQKVAKEEEKARKDADKAAEEATLKAIEDKKNDDLRIKKEEKARKKEVERKQAEEERQRKEADKIKRQQEEKDRQVEAERKQREQKEKERRKREEQKKKEREEREAKEKEVKHRKEREELERRERDVKLRTEREAKERSRREEVQTTQAARRGQPNISVPMPPGLIAHNSSGIQSPHLQIATPAIPKAPAVRQRQASQQGSVQSSPKTPQVTHGSSKSTSPGIPLPLQNTLGPIGPPGKAQNHISHAPPFPSQTTMAPPPGIAPVTSGLGMTPLGINGLPMNHSPNPPSSNRGIGLDMGYQQHGSGANRGYASPSPLTYQNGFPTVNHGSQYMPGTGRGAYNHPIGGPPGMHHPSAGHGSQGHPMQPHSQPHSRQPSGSLDQSTSDLSAPGQPIARPAPIQRPSSTTPQQRAEEQRSRSQKDVEDLSNHLGSSALLGDDTEEPAPLPGMDGRRQNGMANVSRPGFGPAPSFQGVASGGIDPFAMQQPPPGLMWGNQGQFPGDMQRGSAWPGQAGTNWTIPQSAFGSIGGRPHASRPLTVRLLTCSACRSLSNNLRINSFHDVSRVLQQVQNIQPPQESRISLQEMLLICETEGNDQNGGGVFIIKQEEGHTLIKYEPDDRRGGPSMPGRGGAPGDIGSPIPSAGAPAFGGSSGFAAARPFQPLGPGGSITSPSGF
ncbi:MAG: Stress response protein nst1 [Vezdaea aestivalis]|nr:MAG: Stress response protein nst1 [Vezdaea aestivalis]